jgi:hypothetical protein
MGGLPFPRVLALVLAGQAAFSQARPPEDALGLDFPAVGAREARLIAPALLELSLVAAKPPEAPLKQWDFVDASGAGRLPEPAAFSVVTGGRTIPVRSVGFKRRVIYAPIKQWDLRVGNQLYLELESPVPAGEAVEVRNPGGRLWPPAWKWTTRNALRRWSPVLHVNQTGYLPGFAKKAMVGYYLGSLGEMDLERMLAPGETAGSNASSRLKFSLLDAASHKSVFEGELRPRRDHGFPYECYQKVLEADFSAFKTPGEYRLFVEGLGLSHPFLISDDVAGAFARAHALGLYHQRCGTDNAMPYTRFTHGVCHAAPAEVPDSSARYAAANHSLEKETEGWGAAPRQTAPRLKNVNASLYPFLNRGPLDVRGGHHDAGDYSKYTINSASFIHQLLIAVDVFPGVSELDNLGLPESGDGKSDVLQEAKWEADFLAKMQDADGGFYFLVYPRGREYESEVLPDKGDPQVVFPKTTSVTAAATAALAQCASSPAFKKQFPEAANLYLTRAKKGWEFLERAIARHGPDGAYQKITHYGDDFMHDDELAWAACEMFLATGDPACHKRLIEWLDPSSPQTRKWGWWRLYDAYGAAIRSYAFAAKSGRVGKDRLDPRLLEQCEEELVASGEEQMRRAEQSAYGVSFPQETKRSRTAGWFFAGDAAYDLAVASQLDYPEKRDPRPRWLEAIISNLNYEQGCNPVNVTYLTGLGWGRQREIVHQYAQNDRRVLPPTGIPLGCIQAGYGWISLYGRESGLLSFPSDGAESSPYPLYDRWGDAFNLTQEFVIVNQARSLAYLAWLMAQTPLKQQPWRPAAARVDGLSSVITAGRDYTLSLSASNEMAAGSTRIVWEDPVQQPAFGQTRRFSPTITGPAWIEAEIQHADGRRVFAVTNFQVAPRP